MEIPGHFAKRTDPEPVEVNCPCLSGFSRRFFTFSLYGHYGLHVNVCCVPCHTSPDLTVSRMSSRYEREYFQPLSQMDFCSCKSLYSTALIRIGSDLAICKPICGSPSASLPHFPNPCQQDMGGSRYCVSCEELYGEINFQA